MSDEKQLDKTTQDMRAFTIKSLFWGLLGVFIITTYTGFNDYIIKQTYVVGNHFPVGAFMIVFIIACLWNNIFKKLFPTLALNPRELSVSLGMMLVSCWVPSSGLYRYFLKQLVLPFYFYKSQATWQEFEVFQYLPEKLFPMAENAFKGNLDDQVQMGFVQGLSSSNELIPFGDIPFGAWIGPLFWWFAILLVMSGAILSLYMLVHRQWSEHEQLSYPLAKVATMLIGPDKETGKSIFANRLFWWGFVPVFLLYLYNYLGICFPGSMPLISTQWDLGGGFFKLFPILKQSGTYNIHRGALFFTIIGITYFISSEIGLSMGIGNILLVILSAQFYVTTGEPFGAGGNVNYFRAGSYAAVAIMTVYTGWHYYLPVVLKAFGVGKPLPKEREAAWAARIFLLCYVGFIILLASFGLGWMVAFFYVTVLLTFFLVFTRIICETGIPFLQAGFYPSTLLVKLLGSVAIGPGPLVFLLYLGSIFTVDPRECLMPFVATGVKVADEESVGKSKLMPMLFVVIGIALCLGLIATIWTSYSYGVFKFGDYYGTNMVPKACVDEACRSLSYLKDTNQMELASEMPWYSRLAAISPDMTILKYIIAGFIAVLLFSFLRFRFTKWPLHPVIFLVWGCYPVNWTWASFLIGWAIKELIVKFGGGKSYQSLKPLFIGLILGELVMAGVIVIVGFVYYLITGMGPSTMSILPG